MTLKKYQATIAIVLGSLLVTMSCNENANLPNPVPKGDESARLTNYRFDGTEGDPIMLDVATRWISNYTNKNSGNVTAHFFGRRVLEKTLAKSGCMGIRFYYSMDDAVIPTILMIGADGSGENLLPVYGIRGKNSAIDLAAILTFSYTFEGTEGDSIARETSRRWVNNYNLKNPSGIQAHFFGHEIIKQILSQSGCIGLRTYYALNDSGVQQLLLIGVTSSGKNMVPLSSTSGRVLDNGTIADVSYVCPTHCSGSGTSL